MTNTVSIKEDVLVTSQSIDVIPKSDNDPLHWAMLWAMGHYAKSTSRGEASI